MATFDGAEESFTYRIVIEKTGEDGYTMYQYASDDDGQSWYNTYYTSWQFDDTYRNTPVYIENISGAINHCI